jgi:hypothetical protein
MHVTGSCCFGIAGLLKRIPYDEDMSHRADAVTQILLQY